MFATVVAFNQFDDGSARSLDPVLHRCATAACDRMPLCCLAKRDNKYRCGLLTSLPIGLLRGQTRLLLCLCTDDKLSCAGSNLRAMAAWKFCLKASLLWKEIKVPRSRLRLKRTRRHGPMSSARARPLSIAAGDSR
jgi:hypothetical protein